MPSAEYCMNTATERTFTLIVIIHGVIYGGTYNNFTCYVYSRQCIQLRSEENVLEAKKNKVYRTLPLYYLLYITRKFGATFP